MTEGSPTDAIASEDQVKNAKNALDAHVRETLWLGIFLPKRVPRSGSTFERSWTLTLWLTSRALRTSGSFPMFEDGWLRGGPVRRWVPKGNADKPTYVFETGGYDGHPKEPYRS